MNDHHQRFENALELRGLRPNTRRNYHRHLRMLVDFHQGRAPGELGAKDVSAFLVHRSGALGPRSRAQCSSALGFYYRHVEQRPEVMLPIPRSACDPCFGRGRRGVRCGRVPGASRIDGISIGARAAAIRWLEQTDERSAWHLAIIGKRGVTVVEPVATWTMGEPAVTVLDVVWYGGSWMVWYERDDHLWERRYRADGTPIGDERQIAAAVTELYVGVSAGGDRRAVGLVAGAPPRVLEIDRHGLGAVLPANERIVAQRGDDHLVVMPIPDATEGQADLAIVWSKLGRSGWWLFKEGRNSGSSSASGTDGVNLGFISGRLKITYASDEITTTWAPKGGAEWTVRHPVAAAPPADLLAQHSTVTGHRYVAAGRTGLAAAVFQPRGAEPNIVTALVTK